MKVNEDLEYAATNAAECLETIKRIINENDTQFAGHSFNNLKEVCAGALLTFGTEGQINQAIEEMAELTVALNHYRRGRIDRDAVASEIADVIIMMEQLSLIFGVDAVHKWRDSKLERLEKRIEEAKEK